MLPCCLLLSLALSSSHLVSAGFHEQFDITWGNDRAMILDNGKMLNVSLDQTSGIYYHTHFKLYFLHL